MVLPTNVLLYNNITTKVTSIAKPVSVGYSELSKNFEKRLFYFEPGRFFFTLVDHIFESGRLFF